VSVHQPGGAGLFAVALLTTLGATGCKDSLEPLNLAGSPAAASVSSGNLQNGAVGAKLADSLVVTVTDSTGKPVPGFVVTWATTAGTLSQAVDTTDAAGKSSVEWTMGDTPGVFTATATVADLPVVTFTASASLQP
jgi:hypothetical protein